MQRQRFWQKKRFKKRPQTAMGWLCLFALCFALVTVARVVILNFVDPGRTAFMRADPFDPKPIEFVPIKNISRQLIRAVLVSEDDQFFSHSGFQWDSIKKAWQTNQKQHKKVSGASTLTQQLARNLFLTRDKSWARKIKEAGFTVLLELFLSKERILELYLNVAEMGPGIYGVGQASHYHFGTKPESLSQVQSSLLTATLINGKIYGKKPYPSRTVNRQKKILFRMSHYALAIPDFIEKTPVVAVKEDEKTVLSLIKGMTEQEADEPDEVVEEEADMMLVLPPNKTSHANETNDKVNNPNEMDTEISEPADTETTDAAEKKPIFLDEDQ